MSSRELSRNGFFRVFIPLSRLPSTRISELIVVAKRLWPSVQAHAYREQPGKSSDEALAFASEVWEGVLRSVAKTIQRSNGRNWRIKNMEAYLFGAFHHRFKPRSKEGAQKTTDDTSSSFESYLERLRQAHDSKAVRDLEQSIQLKEAVRNMA